MAPAGIAGHALAGIDQEVVVTFRYPVRFTQGLFAPANPTLRDVVQAEGRARLLMVIDAGVAEAHPSLVADVQRYCAAHGDALRLPAPPLVVPGGEAIKNEPGPVSQSGRRSTSTASSATRTSWRSAAARCSTRWATPRRPCTAACV